jgi:hypothetical protein
MIFNKAEDRPENEIPILIAIHCDSFTGLSSGWYDLNEDDYYNDNGDMIEPADVAGWAIKPTVEFK